MCAELLCTYLNDSTVSGTEVSCIKFIFFDWKDTVQSTNEVGFLKIEM